VIRPAVTLPCLHRVGALVLLVVAGGLTVAFDLRVAGLLVVVAGFGLAGYGLAAIIVPSRTRLDRLLATITFAVAVLAVVAEVLSLVVLLGSPASWIVAAVACGVVGGALPARSCPIEQTRAQNPLSLWERVGVRAERVGLTAGGSRLEAVAAALVGLLVVAAGVHLLTVFILSWFSGITVFDTISHYLPRSIRFLQYGTFGVEATYYDFMQYLHQTVVAVQLLFFRSDVLVNPTSFFAAGLTSVAIFALARSLGWPAPYPLFAALVPLSMPIVLLHASTSNFDTFTALWLVLALYFLRQGFATTSHGWLVVAATATALAFASKPTAWFAVPGLGLVWLATVGRAAVRGRLRRAIPTLAICAVILVLVGMPFLLRNVISRGYLVAPPEWQSFQLGGSATGPEHRARLLTFNTLAIGLQLLTPPFLLPERTAGSLDGWFAARAQGLGYRLPDPSITVHTEWPGLIRHVSHRYDSNHAGLGAGFVLVTLPSLIALPFARRRLGPRWWYAVGLVVVGLSYFLVLNAVSIYSVNNIRYLIEMVAVLAAVSPALFVLLPRNVGGSLALIVAAVLVLEMHDVVVHNKQVPPDLVMRIPRDEQYYVVNGNFPLPARAARLLDQKYPPEEMPDIYIEDTGTPSFPDYTFLGPSLLRRTHYLKPPEPSADLPGPYLSRDRGLAERFVASGRAIADQLTADVWLLLPNDRPRVLFWSTRAPDTGLLMLHLQASVPPGSFREPRYAFTLRTVQGEERLRGFEPSPTFEIPHEVASRGTIQVEIRDGDDNRRVERIRIERPRFMGI
jgi:Dolichyl-phosphate-mannose-protein mannosyltransferase